MADLDPSKPKRRRRYSDLPQTSSSWPLLARSQSVIGSTSSASEVYQVWFRHDSEPEIEKLPTRFDWKNVTLDDLVSSTQGCTISHMCIYGNIPPLGRIAPRATHLKLYNKTNNYQFNCIGELADLKELDLSGNKKLQTLPDSIGRLSSLRKLDVSNCNVTFLPDSIGKLTNLEELYLSRNRNLQTLPYSIWNLKSLKNLDVSECSLTSLSESICDLTCLEEVKLSFNRRLQVLPNSIGNLKALKRLYLDICNLTDLPSSIGGLPDLEDLNLSCNRKLAILPESIGNLESLKNLDVSQCNLARLPGSIGKLTDIEELNVSQNRELQILPDSVGKLKSLKTLNVSACNLTSLPESIGGLTDIKRLNLSDNEKLASLPNSIWNLKSLNQLSLSLCYRITLSECIRGLKSLKKLDVSKCNLTRLPESIGELTQLEELDLCENRKLGTLPDSIGKMESLKKLDAHKCNLRCLPESVKNLSNLENLDVSGNGNLLKLHKSLVSPSFPHLNALKTDDCFNLSEPPYFVCQSGLENIKQYYTDLDCGSQGLTLAIIAVIGKKMAGKTSLVRSLQRKTVCKTCRKDVAHSATEKRQDKKVKDETTKVFDFVKMTLGRSSDHDCKTVNAVDFGGDEIYHHAYQLTFRKDCILLVVVNITEYKQQSEEQGWGRREATRRVVFDWISHIYLACPELARPLLVLTHKDEHSPDDFYHLKEELLKTIDELKKELLEDNHIGRKINIFKNAQQTGFFTESDVFEVSHDLDYAAVFTKLEDTLHERVAKSEVTVPDSWYKVIQSIKAQQKSHIYASDLLAGKEEQTKKQHTAILSFMKRSGEILWYRHIDGLKDVIFHDISKVTAMIKQLLDHSSAEDKSVIEPGNLDLLWPTISSPDDAPSIPANIAINLLTTFNLIYGPTTVKHNPECYIIPYFTRRHHFSPSRRDINLQEALVFLGLSIPLNAYQQMTVSFLKLLEKAKYVVYAYGNGATGRYEDSRGDHVPTNYKVIEAQLIHQPDLQSVIIRVKGDASLVERCWKIFLDINRNLTKTVKAAWPATLIRYDFTCPHCILVDELNPEKRSYKDFKMESEKFQSDTRCRNITGVPSPLRHPCGSLQQNEMESLELYIRNIHPYEQHEIRRLMRDSNDDIQNRSPHPQTAIHQIPMSEKVYLMTNTRGRALVINNRCGDIGTHGLGRKASDIDYKHMKTMLEKFGFCISHLSDDKNWTAKEIVDTVHMETELVYQGTTSVHEGLGMFVLVMMSHGAIGTISGHDGKHANLVDIYKLLSSQNFPAMRGKPKLVILQACSGVRKEETERSTFRTDPIPPPGQQRVQSSAPQQAHQQAPIQPSQQLPEQHSHQPTLQAPQHDPQHVPQHVSQRATQQSRRQANQPSVGTSTDNSHLTIDDLLVMKPSFEEHVAYRDESTGTQGGSFFIRALVTVFYRYAGEKDVSTLSDMIQESVRLELKEKGVEQVPITIKTFTNGRKLYLSPGVDMRTSNHPDSFTSRDLPARMKISLNWKRDIEERSTINLHYVKKIVHFKVIRNRDP